MIAETDTGTHLPEIGGPSEGLISTPQETSIRDADFNDAYFLGLEYYPVSVEAFAFAEDVTNRIEEGEQRTNKRGPKSRDALRSAVARVCADLLLAASRDRRQWSFRALSPNSFTGGPVSYRRFRDIFDGLKRMGAIEVVAGFHSRADSGLRSYASRIRATGLFFSIAASHGLSPGNANHHFKCDIPAEPVEVRASAKKNGRWKVRGKKMRPTDTVQKSNVHRFKFDWDLVNDINRFLSKYELVGGTHRGFQRIYNQGDVPGFRWNKGGRLYSIGADSYQQMKKADRLRMTISGAPVAEIDIRASFLTILYAMKQKRLDLSSDPYDVPGLPRSVVKTWVTITLGHTRFHRAWPKESRERLLEKGIVLKGVYPIRKVQELVLERHPILADWPTSETTCFDLMYLESDAIINTLWDLQIWKPSVPAYPVHDSIIVRQQDVDRAIETLEENFEWAVGVKPALAVNWPASEP